MYVAWDLCNVYAVPVYRYAGTVPTVKSCGLDGQNVKLRMKESAAGPPSLPLAGSLRYC